MANRMLVTALIGVAGLSCKGCGSAADPVAMAAAEEEDRPHVEAIVHGNTVFAFDLYAQLRSAEGNLFLSPYSISTALAMTVAGARGQTAEQIAQTLHFTLPHESFHRAFGRLIEQFNDQAQEGDYQLSIANALWLHKDYRFLQGYLDLMSAHYDAALERVDFVAQTELARQKINDWTAERTQDRIKELIPRGALNILTRLVLTNAIYFKGDWAMQFDPGRTRSADFFLSPDKTVKTPLMYRKDRFGYGQTETLQTLELPYKGQALSMVLLLPKDVDGLATLEKELTADNLRRWRQRMSQREVEVYLPTFTIASRFGLTDTLAAMGMPDAFRETADFSAMDGTKELFISEIIHRAFVEVTEEGAEAAAATGVVIGITSIPEPPPVFRADRPFVFLILDNTTQTILFIGRLADPTGP